MLLHRYPQVDVSPKPKLLANQANALAHLGGFDPATEKYTEARTLFTAAGAFQWAGITMPPALGAILMSVSTIVVALNAQLLRRVDLRR